MAGRFITLEGGEGAGKSTQIALLQRAFEAASIPVLRTREPGGSKGAEAIRKLVVEGDADAWDPVTESLLFMTARYHHLETLIKPTLAQGTTVLCDRFFDSTYVYQGISKGVGTAWLKQLYTLLYGTIAPDVTLLLDVPETVGLGRARARSGNETRFENMGTSFHTQVRQGFLALAAAEPERIVVVDASGDVASIHHAIITALNTQLGLALTPVEAA